VRRTFFNLVARNQDDHVKNIAFLMDRQGVWRLSPAFDVAYSYNPSGAWTRQHQMSVNGKRDRFEVADLIAFAGVGGIKPARAKAILAEVSQAVAKWHEHAHAAQIPDGEMARIARAHRRDLFV
jgi:serine/threonine-protein kinase HipA